MPKIALIAPVNRAKKNFVPKTKIKMSAANVSRGINSFIFTPLNLRSKFAYNSFKIFRQRTLKVN